MRYRLSRLVSRAVWDAWLYRFRLRHCGRSLQPGEEIKRFSICRGWPSVLSRGMPWSCCQGRCPAEAGWRSVRASAANVPAVHREKCAVPQHREILLYVHGDGHACVDKASGGFYVWHAVPRDGRLPLMRHPSRKFMAMRVICMAPITSSSVCAT